MTKTPTPPTRVRCTEVSFTKTLAGSNVVCREGDIGILKPSSMGVSHPDAYAYIGFAGSLWAVGREILNGEDDGNLHIFAGLAPVYIDLSDYERPIVADCANGNSRSLCHGFYLSEPMMGFIVQKMKLAREFVIEKWVAALGLDSGIRSLSSVLHAVERYHFDFRTDPGVFANPICAALGITDEGERHMVAFLMEGGRLPLPVWLGNTAAQCHSTTQAQSIRTKPWLIQDGLRYSTNVSEGRAYIGIDHGPVAIIMGEPGTANELSEIARFRKSYGEVIILTGAQTSCEREAKRLSDYLFGVDIISGFQVSCELENDDVCEDARLELVA